MKHFIISVVLSLLIGTSAFAQEAHTTNNTESYAIGDIYSNGEVCGMVINTTDKGRHGTIISLDEACLRWSKQPRKMIKSCGATNKNDGRANMEAIAAHIAAEGLSWSDFPAANWCKEHGKGWYLPAVNEVWLLGTVFCGGSHTSAKRHISKTLNSILRASGGRPLNNVMNYLSSTEHNNPRQCLYSHLNNNTPQMSDCGKEEELFIRAFYRF